MKYENEVTINLPVNKVVELFDNPDNNMRWMQGLTSFELIEGTQGQPGAKARLKFKMRNRDMEMIETIRVRNLPEEFSGTYEAKGVTNHISNHFIDLGNGTTRYHTHNEFEFKGMMKLMGWLMPGAFKKQSQKYLEDFKKFAEGAGL